MWKTDGFHVLFPTLSCLRAQTLFHPDPIPWITVKKEVCMTWHVFLAVFDAGLGKSGVRENGIVEFRVTQLHLALESYRLRGKIRCEFVGKLPNVPKLFGHPL